jgi:hypothetical protein
MNALSDEIREAVRVALADLLPRAVEEALATTIAALHVGDVGDEVVDAEQAGIMLGMNAPALRRANERGTAPVGAIRIGRRLRWRRRDLLAYLASRRDGARGA